jgi:hypothetical protein
MFGVCRGRLERTLERTRVELQDPGDSVLLLEVRADLQKVSFFNFPFRKTLIFFLCF